MTHVGFEPLLENLRSSDVVGVRVRLEHVVHAKRIPFCERDDLLDRNGAGFRRERIEVEDGVDGDRVATHLTSSKTT